VVGWIWITKMKAYTSRTHYGVVIKNSTGEIVAPISDTTDPLYLEWLTWCELGNEPDIDDTEPPQDITP
jgi:hypothetical protein